MVGGPAGMVKEEIGKTTQPAVPLPCHAGLELMPVEPVVKSGAPVGVPLAVALYSESTPVVPLQLICRRADMYTYVTSVATGGAEKPQAAIWVEAVIAPEAVATKSEGVEVEMVFAGTVIGKPFVSSGPSKVST